MRRAVPSTTCSMFILALIDALADVDRLGHVRLPDDPDHI